MVNLDERIKRLCFEHDVSITQMCSDLGLSRNTYYSLKRRERGYMRMATIEKIARYFGMTAEEFLLDTNAPLEDKVSLTDSALARSKHGTSADELISILQELKEKPELRVLFKSARGATSEQILATSKLLDSMKGGNSDDYTV